MMRRRSDLPPVDPQPWSSLVPAVSFYARLANWREVLVDDEDYAPRSTRIPTGLVRPSRPLWWCSPCFCNTTTIARMPKPRLGCVSICAGNTLLGSPLRMRASTQPFCVTFAVSCWSAAWSASCSSGWLTRPGRRGSSPKTLPNFWIAATFSGQRERGTPTRSSGVASASCSGLWATCPQRGEPASRAGSLVIVFGGTWWIRKHPRNLRSTGAIPKSPRRASQGDRRGR
jgi:hypothetical protein